MDKYEYKLKLEQIRNLVEAKDYKTAAQIADSINWKKVKSVATLCMIGEIYEKTKQLEESREILLMAYERSPVGRNIIYRLTLVALKLGNIREAQEYYEEFLEIAPHDNMKYVLKYEIARGKGASLPELIAILEEFKEREYTEEWAFELAYLYHKNGDAEKCVEVCDELILWFGEGKYVERALELKMLYQPLNKLQEDKYRRFRQRREGAAEAPRDSLSSGKSAKGTMKNPKVQSDAGRFNTMNLQAELAKSMQQIIDATEQDTVNETISSIKKMVGEMPLYQDAGKAPAMEPLEEPDAGKASAMEPSEEPGAGKAFAMEPSEEPGAGKAFVMESSAELEAASAKAGAATQAEEEPTGRETAAPVEGLFLAEEPASAGASEPGEEPEPWASGEDLLPVEPSEEQSQSEDDLPEPTLNIDFKGILAEDYDGQMRMRVPDAPKPDLQITGQMSIEDILAEWEKTKEAARIAIAEAERRKLEEAKAKALKEAESLMERLTDSLPPEETLKAAVKAMQQQEEERSRVPLAATQEMPDLTSMRAQESQPGAEGAAADLQLGIEGAAADLQSEAENEAANLQLGIEQAAANLQSEAENEAAKSQPEAEEAAEESLVRMLSEEITLEHEEVEEAPLTSLNPEQKQIFSYFTLISGMERQLCQALEGARQRKKNIQTSAAGNLAIQGGKGSGKTVLATDFVKAFQRYANRSGGKVGKISASVLNQKDMEKLFEALGGGCLIIERAGDLSRESVEKLSRLMEQETGGLLVILEDDRDGVEKVLGRNAGFAKKFTERIRIPIFTSDELVAFARVYARENQCEIEDMGVLALYNSISNIQKLDEATTLTEVKEIMDRAIYRATKSGLKKLFGGKRSPESGLTLIREKDFDE